MPLPLANGNVCGIEIPTLDVGRLADFYAKVFSRLIEQRGDGQAAFDDTAGPAQ